MEDEPWLCCRKVSTEDLLSATTEQIQFGTGFDGPVLESNHQVHHLLEGVSQCKGDTRLQCIICSIERVFEHCSEEKKKKKTVSIFPFLLCVHSWGTKTFLMTSSTLHLPLPRPFNCTNWRVYCTVSSHIVAHLSIYIELKFSSFKINAWRTLHLTIQHTFISFCIHTAQLVYLYGYWIFTVMFGNSILSKLTHKCKFHELTQFWFLHQWDSCVSL